MDFQTNKDKMDLEEAIFRVVAFFDMFSYPLTREEIFWMLGRKSRLFEVAEALDAIETVSVKNGFVFLPGREEIIEIRMRRYNITDQKFKKALRICRLFKNISWIKMIAVGNIMGAHNLKEKSDIDLFIITESKRIWLTRFFCNSIATILRMRPRPGKEKDKICLSFFISEDNLNLENLKLGSDDWYFNYWLANLAPIYESDGEILKNFYQANNWLLKYLPNWQASVISFKRDVGRPVFFSRWLGIFSCFESLAKFIQLKILPKKLKQEMNKDTRVVVNDRILKFHINDRREIYNEKFNV